MIRGSYLPTGTGKISLEEDTDSGEQPSWARLAVTGDLTADQLVQHYCHWIHQKTGSYEATARKLGIDRRTVKSKIALIQ
jgi:hypothetical protein